MKRFIEVMSAGRIKSKVNENLNLFFYEQHFTKKERKLMKKILVEEIK